MAFKQKLSSALFFLCIFTFLTSCSSSPKEEKQQDKSSIDQLSDETAKKIVDHIQTPINTAQDVTDMANQHNAQMQKMRENIKKE